MYLGGVEETLVVDSEVHERDFFVSEHLSQKKPRDESRCLHPLLFGVLLVKRVGLRVNRSKVLALGEVRPCCGGVHSDEFAFLVLGPDNERTLDGL